MTDEDDAIQLTTEQEDALVQDRNVAITAGAGTGKTTTLTERYSGSMFSTRTAPQPFSEKSSRSSSKEIRATRTSRCSPSSGDEANSSTY